MKTFARFMIFILFFVFSLSCGSSKVTNNVIITKPNINQIKKEWSSGQICHEGIICNFVKTDENKEYIDQIINLSHTIITLRTGEIPEIDVACAPSNLFIIQNDSDATIYSFGMDEGVLSFRKYLFRISDKELNEIQIQMCNVLPNEMKFTHYSLYGETLNINEEVILEVCNTMPNLECLTFIHCNRLPEFTPLRQLPKLNCICLSNCMQLNDIKPLYNLEKIKEFHIYKCPALSQKKLDEFRAAYPDCKVITGQ